MSASAARLNLGKAKLLVVEDNPQAMELLSQILLGFGVTQPVKATSLEQAKEVMEAKSFDLILLDAELPGEDSFAFGRNLRRAGRSRNQTTGIIMLSAFCPEDKVKQARDAGINFVIAKPIVPTVLLERLEWLSRERREFITCDSYCGPDRRFQTVPLPEGQEERREEALQLTSQPERALSQDEINALFD